MLYCLNILITWDVAVEPMNALYYLEKNESNLYSYDSGLLDVHRLIDGKPYFKTLAPMGEKKRKTLILADWTAATWSEKKIASVRKQLELLIRQGFSVYAWQSDHMLAVTEKNLSQLLQIYQTDFRRKITPIDTSDLIQHAILEHGLTTDC